jgi:hypothetical protein
MKYFYYLSEEDASDSIVIRIEAKTKPSKSGKYKLEQYLRDVDWYFGPWEEVSWGVLKKMKYIGSTKV